MSSRRARFPALGTALAMQAVLAGPVLAQGSAPPSPQNAVAEADAAPPPGLAPPDERPVLYVTGVEVLRTTMDPPNDIVWVTGLAASKGWSYPQLVPTSPRMAADGILDLQLIATPPDQSQQADGFVPVSAVLVLDPGDPYRGVRVRGAQNAVQVASIPGSNTAKVTASDCHDCVGRLFVANGQSDSGQPDAIRQKNLPGAVRVIAPGSGMQGGMLDPDRLSLVIGEDGKIVDAFWE